MSDRATAERAYGQPGVYSEVLKVTHAEGRVDYDFAVVNVLDKGRPDQLPPSIHAAYSPTFGIQPGDPVTFLVRTFRTTDGRETWDFADGSPKVEVQSDGNDVLGCKPPPWLSAPPTVNSRHDPPPTDLAHHRRCRCGVA